MAELNPTVVVTGATGFVGRELVRQFQAAGWPVRGLGHDLSALPEALAGAKCVAHLVGIIVERGRNTFDRVHVEVTHEVVEAALGTQKPLVHLPLPVARIQAAVFEKLLRNPPFTRDQLIMLAEDNVGDPGPAGRDLLLESEPLAAGLRRSLA